MTRVFKFVFYNPLDTHPHYKWIEEMEKAYGKHKSICCQDSEDIRNRSPELPDDEPMLIHPVHERKKDSRYESEEKDEET